jgi:putative transposase
MPVPQSRRKPDWVKDKLLRLHVLMGTGGVRKLAAHFNRLHGPAMTVSKTYVAELLIRHRYELLALRKEIRHAPPKPYRRNAVWGLDMSFFTDASGQMQPMLGIVDHGSRWLVHLGLLSHRNRWTLFGHLCWAIGRHGKPKAVRTDNEAVFNSWVFTGLLKLLGIRHQRKRLGSPWQNGRIERVFGSLKPVLRQLFIPSGLALAQALREFVFWHNHARPHQALGGLTPWDAWREWTWKDFEQHGRDGQAMAWSGLDGVVGGIVWMPPPSPRRWSRIGGGGASADARQGEGRTSEALSAKRRVQPARLGTQTGAQRACAPLGGGERRLSAQKSDKWRTNRGVEFEKSAGSRHEKQLADTDMTTRT